MKCPNCGMNISENTRMCVHCGTSIQPFGNPIAQPVQNNVQQQGVIQQQGVVQQQVPQVVEEKPKSSGKIVKIVLIIILVLGIGIAGYAYYNKIKMEALVQEEFEYEADEYFEAVSIAANANVLVSEGQEINSGKFYYVLIDDDIKDKEHPLSPKEKEDKEYFDGKGYILIITGYGTLDSQGFVCLNNGDDEKRFTTIKTMSVYDKLEGDTNNSFRDLKIDEKGKCDINELLGRTSEPLYQLTAK